MSKNFSNVILEPLITEKTSALSQLNKYTFIVDNFATKDAIKDAFKKIFPDRKVLSIKTIKVLGHNKRTKSGIKLLSDKKKAIISVDGPRIDYFPEIS